MQPKLLRTDQAEFVAGEWDGRNGCGLQPLDDAVLILPDKAAERTKGGVFMPEDLNSRQSKAAQSGVVVAVGEGAFVWNTDRTRPFAGRKPQPGDRVTFGRYSGQIEIGDDNEEYRLMDDRCIRGVKIK